MIALMLPCAGVIHWQRDPMNTCLSIYFNHYLAFQCIWLSGPLNKGLIVGAHWRGRNVAAKPS